MAQNVVFEAFHHQRPAHECDRHSNDPHDVQQLALPPRIRETTRTTGFRSPHSPVAATPSRPAQPRVALGILVDIVDDKCGNGGADQVVAGSGSALWHLLTSLPQLDYAQAVWRRLEHRRCSARVRYGRPASPARTGPRMPGGSGVHEPAARAGTSNVHGHRHCANRPRSHGAAAVFVLAAASGRRELSLLAPDSFAPKNGVPLRATGTRR
jgi:hypothetical protein